MRRVRRPVTLDALMRRARATYVAIIVLCGAGSSALAERRVTDRSARRSRPTIESSPAKAQAPRVLGARLTLAPEPVIERHPTWFELPEAAVRKPFRPRLMVHPMGFATGGGGLKLKLRY